MRKKDKLYTVNPWNKNLFAGGGFEELAAADQKANPWNYTDDFMYDKSQPDYTQQYMNSKNMFGISKKNNPLSKGNLRNANNAIKNTPGASAAISAAATLVGGLANKGISGGLESGAGSTISGLGSAAGGIVGQFNPLAGAAVTVGSQVLGGLTNRAFGSKVDTAALNAANEGTARLNNFVSNAQTFDGVKGPAAEAGIGDVYKGGWFSSRKARRKNEALRRQRQEALAFANRSVENNINNLVDDQLDNALANYAAYGGPLEMIGNNDNMGAIEYGFMNDWLTNKMRQTDSKEKTLGLNGLGALNTYSEGGGIHIKKSHEGRLTKLKERTGKTEAELWAEGRPEVRKMITFSRNARKWKKAMGGFLDAADNLFALGGDLQSHGADWTDGLMQINAGGSHEMNPNEGVQLGVDGQNVPNLVEEGETVYDDYVYSNRIMVNDDVKKRFHLPKKKDITYADVSRKLEKEVVERTNDPISQAGFKAMMKELAEMQEAQKVEMEAERAREAFEQLSDEEKAMVMDRVAQEQQAASMAQEEALMNQQGQVIDQQGQVIPEEVAPVEEQMACGGKINRYDDGGSKNAGTWKQGTFAENWNTYTRNGLRDYLENILARINATSDEKEKQAIRQEAIETVGNLQQAYKDAYQSSLTPSKASEKVKKLQELFQAANGNAYFGKIADNINLPVGANTTDREGTWVDSYWGPRTSIRNWGSTEYGDESTYKDLADLAAQAGLRYAPNEAWTYGDNGHKLYGLSMPEIAEAVAAEQAGMSDKQNNYPSASDFNTPEAIMAATVAANPDFAPGGKYGPQAPETTEPDIATPVELENGKKVLIPKHAMEELRYAGLFGPAVGLGLQLAGVGKPDYSGLNAAVAAANQPAHLAKWKPIGNYLTYKPMDIWFEQNKMDANARATDRALLNSNSPSRIAGLIANGYNTQLADGELYRKALEYNDAQRKAVEDFNRGTDQYNSQAYQRNSEFNADALNRAKQYQASLAMNAAAQKMNADAGWYNSLYGNIGGLFKGIGELGRENAQRNMLADLGATGYFDINPDYYNPYGMWKWGTVDELKKQNKRMCGGKMKKGKGRRGLTF